MPGYLSNRLISIDVASAADLSALEATINSSISSTNSNLSATNTNLTNLTNRVTAAEENIEDLQLQIGV
jgi:peptidoglycan hydrolase CwlO-like protein